MATRLQETAGENLSALYSKSRELAADAADMSRKLYNQSREWLPENSGKVIGLASAGLAIGMVGYRIGKSASQTRPAPTEQLQQAASRISGVDLSPLFRFLSLWMLYRLAR